jgi:hypothetical protein
MNVCISAFPVTRLMVMFIAICGLSETSASPALEIQSGRQVVEREIPKAGGSFTIEVGGAADPVMRRMEIVGPVVSPKVVCDRWIDMETPATVLKSILRPGMTDREKALAVFEFCMENFANNLPYIWDDGRFACALGFGHCGPRNNAQMALSNAAGIRWMNLQLPNHNCFQFFYDKKWHVLDVHHRVAYPNLMGDDIAGVEELMATPELISRHADADMWEYTRYNKKLLEAHTADMVKTYTSGKGRAEGQSGKKNDWDNNRISYKLRVGERIVFWWDRREQTPLWDGEPKIQKLTGATDTTTPQLIYEPDLAKSEAQEDVLSAQNIGWSSGRFPLGVAMVGKDATAVWEFSSYYNVMGGSIEGEFSRASTDDTLRISASVDGGRTWQMVWEHTGQGMIREKIDLSQKVLFAQKCYSKGLRSYRVRIEMKAARAVADVGVGQLRFVTELMANNRALPALRRGDNVITVTAASAPRPFKVIYVYDEVNNLTADCYDPVEGMAVKISATVTNRSETPAKDVKVQFYDGDPAKLGKKIGAPVLIPFIVAGKAATAELEWGCTATGDRAPYFTIASSIGPTETKPFYYCHSAIYALVNPGKERLTVAQTAELPRLNLFIRQRPKLSINEPFILIRKDGQNNGGYRIRAIVRNICAYEKWVYVRGTTVKNVTVRFFDDGTPGKNESRQIGNDQVIPSIAPLGFMPVEVGWDGKGLPAGKHSIRVVVDPDGKIAERDTKTPNTAVKEFELK